MSFDSRRRARELGRRGGLAKAAKLRAATTAPKPFAGSMLDMMDAAGLTGATWEAWRTFWRAVFGLPMSEADLERFARHTGRQAPPADPLREAWLIEYNRRRIVHKSGSPGGPSEGSQMSDGHS